MTDKRSLEVCRRCEGRFSRIWAVTSLFNPAGYRSRIENFKTFRKRLHLPLAAIELAFGNEPFMLGHNDADKVVQIRGGDPMWQKERLLNTVLDVLPVECDKVVWIDSDMIVPDPEWPAMVSLALDEWPLVQPFSVVHHLNSEGGRTTANRATVAIIRSGGDAEHLLRLTVDRNSGAPSSGHIWAAQRSVLERHGWYDCCIVGGGDTAYLCAAFGRPEDAIALHCMGAAQAKRYLAWALPLFEEVHSRVGFLRLLAVWRG